MDQPKPTRSARALAQPFKSPLRLSATTPTKSATSPAYTSPTKQLTHSFSTSPARPAVSSPLATSPAAPLFINRHTPRTPAPSAELRALQRQDASLAQQIRRLRARRAQVTQARTYEDNNSDARLEALAEKWRAAAQTAARELFEVAAVRVERMGGVQEFARRTTRKRGWYDDDELGEGEEAERERARRLAVARDEYDYDIVEATTTSTVENESDEFTIEMMLRTLNVDPTLLFP
ncbi:uncharacterized protein V1518DRAFT_434475 [Limtongia smithiae]|uniref:uncharacterized protein n=1 Tax=Limtongia smithiae TaxID=1125753 RepID=UPI0034CE50D6